MMGRVNKITMSHDFFSYLPEDVRKETQERIERGASSMIVFEDNTGADVFAAVVDFDAGDFLHVREVGGHFVRYHEHFFAYMSEVARRLGKGFLSLKTKIKGVDYLARKHGFKYDDFGDMMVKV